MQISGWENASPRTKRVVMGGIALAVFVVFAGIIAMMDRSGKKPRAGVKTESESTMMMPSRKNTDMEGMAANATAMQRRIQTLEAENKAGASGVQEQIKQLRDLVSTTSAQKDLPELRIQVGQLSKKLDDMIAAKAEAATRAPNPSKVMPPLDKVVPKKPADGASMGSSRLLSLPSLPSRKNRRKRTRSGSLVPATTPHKGRKSQKVAHLVAPLLPTRVAMPRLFHSARWNRKKWRARTSRWERSFKEFS